MYACTYKVHMRPRHKVNFKYAQQRQRSLVIRRRTLMRIHAHKAVYTTYIHMHMSLSVSSFFFFFEYLLHSACSDKFNANWILSITSACVRHALA